MGRIEGLELAERFLRFWKFGRQSQMGMFISFLKYLEAMEYIRRILGNFESLVFIERKLVFLLALNGTGVSR